MFRTIEDFLTVWNQEARITSKLFAGLTDELLGRKVTEEERDIARIA